MAKIFLSHNSKDKPFVRQLGNALIENSHDVWIDEAELVPGDSLIVEISKALADIDYVAAVISENSIDSNWVKKELSYAMTDEIAGQRVRVIPILIGNCTIPHYLRDKLYADFRNPGSFQPALLQVLRALGTPRSKNEQEVSSQRQVGESILILRERHDLEIISKADRSLGYYFLFTLVITIPLIGLALYMRNEFFAFLCLKLMAIQLISGYLFVCASHFSNEVLTNDKRIVVEIDDCGVGYPFSQKWFRSISRFGNNHNFRMFIIAQTSGYLVATVLLLFIFLDMLKL